MEILDRTEWDIFIWSRRFLEISEILCFVPNTFTLESLEKLLNHTHAHTVQRILHHTEKKHFFDPVDFSK
jgi:hypothetical protein